VRLTKIKASILYFLTASFVCILTPTSGWSGTAKQIMPAGGAQQDEVRTMIFPKDCCIGSLLLEDSSQRRQVAGAIGNVTIRVPKNSRVTFDANSKIVKDPKILESVTAPGVDCVRLRITSFDEKEDGKCDQAISHIGHFTGTTILDLDRSDASDVGISHLPLFKHLRNISCRSSSVTSGSFKTLLKFPTIKDIDFSECVIKSADLKDLAGLPKLEQLNLSMTRLTSDDMKYLAKISSLKSLMLGNNPGINNEGLKHLAALPNLASLRLVGTKVTPEGLTQLRNLPLGYLELPSASSVQQASLRKLFPHTVIHYSTPPRVNSQDAVIFAPLK
jgi:hypothetical protein